MIVGSLLVTDGELRALARGLVPLRVRAQALELSTSLLLKLRANAARPVHPPKRMAKAPSARKRTE
jgi:hypothetical protein